MGGRCRRLRRGSISRFGWRQENDTVSCVRCYSLSDRPRQDYYRATVKRIGPPPDKSERICRDGAAVSFTGRCARGRHDRSASAGRHIFDRSAGERADRVDRGRHWRYAAGEHAGGDRSRGPVRREVHALFGFRNGAEHPFKERLASLAEENPNIRLHVSYSAPRTADVLYRDLQPPRADHAGAACGRCCRRTTISFTCAGRGP